MEREDEESAADDGAETEEDTAATLLLCAVGANAEADAPNASRQRALRVIILRFILFNSGGEQWTARRFIFSTVPSRAGRAP